MELQDIKELIIKYNLNQASEEERALLIEWYERIQGAEPQFVSGEFELLKNEAYQDLERYRSGVDRSVIRISLWPRIVAAAVILILSGIAVFYYFDISRNAGNSSIEIARQHDIAPGRNTAMLRLANGKVINLSDSKTGVVIEASKLTYNDGSKVQVSSGSQSLGPIIDPSLYSKLIELSTPRGGTYQVILPDGTKVWLNAASSIKFPASFAGLKQRVVQLAGEAYFEVTRNKHLPFIVRTLKQEVEVLGTHFNINSYIDEGVTKTTLLEGSVRVALTPDSLSAGNSLSSLRGGRTKQSTLLPNQQAILSNTGIKVQQVDVNDAVAWKNGIFQFNDADIQTVMRQISRWYNVDIIYEGGKPSGIYQGQISRNVPVSKVLDMLTYAGIKFKIKGKSIIVKP